MPTRPVGAGLGADRVRLPSIRLTRVRSPAIRSTRVRLLSIQRRFSPLNVYEANPEPSDGRNPNPEARLLVAAEAPGRCVSYVLRSAILTARRRALAIRFRGRAYHPAVFILPLYPRGVSSVCQSAAAAHGPPPVPPPPHTADAPRDARPPRRGPLRTWGLRALGAFARHAGPVTPYTDLRGICSLRLHVPGSANGGPRIGRAWCKRNPPRGCGPRTQRYPCADLISAVLAHRCCSVRKTRKLAFYL